jgi:hypothetical protein
MQAPAAWSRKHWVGNLGAGISVTGFSDLKLTGITEHAGLASNLDIVVDLTQATRPTGVAMTLAIATYAISHVGQKVYQGQWSFALPTYASGIAPPPTALVKSSYPIPMTLGGTSVLQGYTGILQNGGVASMLWGIEAGVFLTSGVGGQFQAITNLFIGSIAHGREI